MTTEPTSYANNAFAYGTVEAGATPTVPGNLSDAIPAHIHMVADNTGGGVSTDGMNFSVFKLEQVFDVFYNKIAGMCSELTSVKDKASTASRIVASEDSGLGEAWDNVGVAMSKFEQKLVDLTTEINVNIKNYVEETVKNEVAAATNTEAIAKDISRITSDLDAIFQ